MPRPVRFALLLICVATVFSGCGGSKDDKPVVKASRAEKEIHDGVLAELDVPLDVDCPSHEPIKKGGTFTCTASSHDTDDLEIKVRQTNTKGSIRWDARILATARYETNISQYIQQQRKLKVDVTCPDAVPIEDGGRFTCEARDPKTGETRDIDVIQQDDKGNISFSS